MPVCMQLVGGQFEMESNFVINDPDTILQMLTLMDSCSVTLQASSLNTVLVLVLILQTKFLYTSLNITLLILSVSYF